MNWQCHRVAVAEWMVIALLAALLADWVCEPENVRQPDYVYYYHPAGVQLLQGLSPYGFITKWGDTNPMPPWFTLLIAPLSLLPRKPAAWSWLAFNLGMVAGIIVLAARLFAAQPGVRRILLAVLALSLWRPTSTHLSLGQSTLLVTIAAVGALLAAERGRLWLAGVLMVAASSKPHLVFLLGLGLTIFGWRRQRSLGVAGGFAIALCTALLACLAVNTAWVGDLLHRPPGVYDYWGITVNLRTLLALPFGPHPVADALYWIVFAVGSALVLRLWAKSDRPLAELGAMTLAATLLLTPYAQPHDYVLLIPGVFLLAMRACSQPPTRRALLLTALVLGFWAAGSLHKGLLTLLESRFVWPRLESLVGEKAMDTIWHGIKGDARFILMLLPTAILLVLFRHWKRRDPMTCVNECRP